MMKPRILVIALGMIVLVFGLLGYKYANNNTRNQQNDKTVGIDIDKLYPWTVAPITWKKYENNNIGIRFEYPSDWGDVEVTQVPFGVSPYDCHIPESPDRRIIPEFFYGKTSYTLTFKNKFPINNNFFARIYLTKVDSKDLSLCSDQVEGPTTITRIKNNLFSDEYLFDGWAISSTTMGYDYAHTYITGPTPGYSASQNFNILTKSWLVQSEDGFKFEDNTPGSIEYNTKYSKCFEFGVVSEHCGVNDWLDHGKFSAPIRRNFDAFNHLIQSLVFTN